MLIGIHMIPFAKSSLGVSSRMHAEKIWKSKNGGSGVSHEPDASKWARESCVDCAVLALSGDRWWCLEGWFVGGCWGVWGSFFVKLLLASDINIRYHVLRVLFIQKTKKYADIRVFLTRISWQVLGLPVTRELGCSTLCGSVAQAEEKQGVQNIKFVGDADLDPCRRRRRRSLFSDHDLRFDD